MILLGFYLAAKAKRGCSPMAESEAKTRRERIDPPLKDAGWDVRGPGKTATGAPAALSEFPTTNGPADYALVAGSPTPIGVVEANKVTTAPAAVLSQAERYSKGHRWPSDLPLQVRRPDPLLQQRETHPLSRYPACEGQTAPADEAR